MLDFRIYTFLAVCDCMNYTKAAERLHITQPAVSQHIRYLEKLYETKLFLHDGKSIALSPSGEILLKAATAVKNDEIILKEKMHQTENAPIPFHFGVTRTIGDFLIARPLSLYQNAHPDTEIHVQVSNTSDLLSKLHTGELNFALIEGYFKSNEYSSRPFSSEDFIAVASSHHKFDKYPLELSDLTKECLIIRETGSGTREVLEKNLEARNMSISDFSRQTEIGSVHSIIDFVKADCGITFLYRIAVKKELDSGVLTEIQLGDLHMKHDFTFIWNQGSIFSSYYEDICDELQAYRDSL